MMKRASWKEYQKQIAEDNYYYGRSCIRQNFFPGSEKLFIDMLHNDLGKDLLDDPMHSSCTGIGYHSDIVPLETIMTVVARQFALMTEAGYENFVTSCITSFGVYSEILATWHEFPETEEKARENLFAGVKGELGKVVAGGAMMGPAVENLSYPTTKTTSGLIFLSKAAAEPAPVNPCIRCGRCVEYCPMGLEPVEVNQAYAARDVQELGKLHADYCFNCGSCSFVCPAKRPVTQMMSLAKAFYLGEIKKGGNK